MGFEANAKSTLNDIYIYNLLQEKGIGDFEEFFGKYSYHNHKLWDRYTKGFIKQEELRWKRMWLTLLDYKIADELLSRKLSSEFLSILPGKTILFPYTIEILEYLLQKKYHLHLITNGFDAIQHNKLQNTKLKKYFTQIITSEASNSLKPNKEIFDYALQQTKASIDESIMIGDNIDADILGAKKAGWDTVYVNHLNNKTFTEANYTVFSLKDLEFIF